MIIYVSFSDEVYDNFKSLKKLLTYIFTENKRHNDGI